MAQNHQIRPIPEGIIPIDLLSSQRSTPRRRGRPRVLPDLREKQERTPEKAHTSLRSDSPLTPTLSSQGHADAQESTIASAEQLELEGSDPFTSFDNDGQEEIPIGRQHESQFEKWISQGSSPLRRVLAEASRPSPAPATQNRPADPLFSVHPIRGLTEIKGFLVPLRNKPSEKVGYESKEEPFGDLRRIFDLEPHDYLSISTTVSSYAKREWCSEPGLFPCDVRARLLRLWVDPHVIKRSPDAVVFRAKYRCNGSCMLAADRRSSLESEAPFAARDTTSQRVLNYVRNKMKESPAYRTVPKTGSPNSDRSWSMGTWDSEDFSTAQEPEEDMEQDDDENANKDADGEKVKQRTQYRCSALFIVEVTAAQSASNRCTILRMTESYHTPCGDLSKLRTSPTIRGMLHHLASGIGQTESRLKEMYNRLARQDAHAQWVTKRAPHRAPGNSTFRTACRTASQVDRLDTSPLAAIKILAKQNPDCFLAKRFVPLLDPEASTRVPGLRRLECVMASRFTLATGLLQGKRFGWFMDSSWRGKNSFRCPLTVLVTLNEYHRMIPVAAMISDHADEEAYSLFLSAVKKAIYDLARKVIEDHDYVKIDGISRDEMLAACQAVRSQWFAPKFMMIDGDNAERSAIERVFPGIPIRACQFHVMQAVRARCKRIFGRSVDRDRQAARAMEAFRECQRCPTKEDWPHYYGELRKRIIDIAGDDNEAWDLFDRYVQRSWFSDSWRPLVVDYGMAPGITRDGPWSTNNYAEATFRVFDVVFLKCRQNKRLDRLCTIILCSWFPFYEHMPHTKSRPPPELEEALFGGFELWEAELVNPCTLDWVPERHRSHLAQGSSFCIKPHNSDAGTFRLWFCGRKEGRSYCSCTAWRQTGKMCKHLWAAAVFELCGPMKSFEDRSAAIEAHLLAEKESESKDMGENGGLLKPDTSDLNDNEEFEDYWGHGLDSTHLCDININGPHSHTSLQGLAPSTPIRQQPIIAETATNSEKSSPIMRRHNVRSRSPSMGHLPAILQMPAEAANLPFDNAPTYSEEISAQDIQLEQSPNNNADVCTQAASVLRCGTEECNRATETNLAGDFEPAIKTSASIATASLGSTAGFTERGRPPRTVPLHPGRALVKKRKRSTLALKARPSLSSNGPVGVIRMGNECFAISLLQVLTRNSVWPMNWEKFIRSNPLAQHNPVVQLVSAFHKAQGDAEARSFPDMLATLHAHGVLDSPDQQEDPLVFLCHLEEYLNSLTDETRFTEVYEFDLKTRLTCPNCASTRVLHGSSDAGRRTILLVRPNDTKRQELVLPELLKEGMCLTEPSGHRCSNAACAQAFHGVPVTTFSSTAPLLLIGIGWGLTENERWGPLVDHSKKFPVPRQLSLDNRVLHKADTQAYDYTLVGVVCRIGDTCDQGHYVSIVRAGTGSEWFLMDDAHVEPIFSPQQEANAKGRYPVLLLYQSALATPTSGNSASGSNGQFQSIGHRPSAKKAKVDITPSSRQLVPAPPLLESQRAVRSAPKQEPIKASTQAQTVLERPLLVTRPITSDQGSKLSSPTAVGPFVMKLRS